MTTKRKPPARPKAPALEVAQVSPEDLYLDPKNPRLAGLELHVQDQEKILSVLWKDLSVDEVVDSIAANGYWPHEVLFVTRESGKLVAIEGNRRLAAVKLLRDPSLSSRIGAAGVPRLSVSDRRKLDTLPVYECVREAVWDFIGFKHVNGPQDWDSIAKAQYVARVHNDFKIPLEDIARTIGDRHDTVLRLYRGLMVLEQAEKQAGFNREDRWNRRFAYSHLWTGLGYTGIQRFLGMSPDEGFKPNPVPQDHVKHLGELCVWLYGSTRENKPPLVRSQNPDLRRLDEVLQSKKGVAALRRDLPLEICLKLSRGDERLLREALVEAEQSLKEARGYTPTGYTGDQEVFQAAKTVRKLAQSIAEEMEAWHDAHGTRKGDGHRG
jgi:hypothetical protein